MYVWGDEGSSERVSLRHHDPHLALEHFRPHVARFGTSFLSIKADSAIVLKHRKCFCSRIGLTKTVNMSEKPCHRQISELIYRI